MMSTKIILGTMVMLYAGSYGQLNVSPVIYSTNERVITTIESKFDVTVTFQVKPFWYIYAPTGVNADQGMIETKVAFTAPPGFTREGKLKIPETHFKNGFEILDGKDVAIVQTFQPLASVKPGNYVIRGKVTWQSCSDNVCLPPVTEHISINVKVE